MSEKSDTRGKDKTLSDLEARLDSLASNHVFRGPAPSVEIKVKMTFLSSMMLRFNSALFSEIEDVIGNARFTLDEFNRYVYTLVVLRYLQVTDQRNAELSDVYKKRRYYSVPAFYFLLLLKFGQAYDSSNAVKFMPVMDIDYDAVITDPHLMTVISDELRRIEDLGLNVCDGIPRENEGDVAFMGLALLGEEIVHYRSDVQPKNIILHTLVETQLLDVSSQPFDIKYLYRNRYGLSSAFEADLVLLAKLRGRPLSMRPR